MKIYRLIGNNKTADLDAMPSKTLKLAVKISLEWFIGVFELCIFQAISFPLLMRRIELLPFTIVESPCYFMWRPKPSS